MEYNKIFGIEIYKFCELDLGKAYDLVKVNTNYLDDISKDTVKEIKGSDSGNIYVLLKNGKLFKDGDIINTNVKTMGFSFNSEIYSISNDKKITHLTGNDQRTRFIDNSNCEYRKIIVDVLAIIGLTNEGIIRVYGTLVCDIVDYEMLIGNEDLGYNVDKEDYVVKKQGRILSLFRNVDYTDSKDTIKFSGKGKDYWII